MGVQQGFVSDFMAKKSPASIKGSYNSASGADNVEAVPEKRSAHEIISQPRNAKTLILGDTNHANNKIKEFVAQPQMMKALSNAGVKHMMLEVPSSQEKHLHAYENGEMSRDDFVEKMSDRWETGYYDDHARERGEMTADIVDNAAQNGIQVHFVDGNEGITSRYQEAYQGGLTKGLDDYAAQRGLTKREVANQLSNPETAPQVQQHLYGYLQKNDPAALTALAEDNPDGAEFMKRRVGEKVDKALGERIDAASNGEKSAVFYGSAHNIATNISGGSVKIDIVGNAQDAVSTTTGFKTRESADYAVGVEDGKVFRSPQAENQIPQAEATQDRDVSAAPPQYNRTAPAAGM